MDEKPLFSENLLKLNEFRERLPLNSVRSKNTGEDGFQRKFPKWKKPPVLKCSLKAAGRAAVTRPALTQDFKVLSVPDLDGDLAIYALENKHLYSQRPKPNYSKTVHRTADVAGKLLRQKEAPVVFTDMHTSYPLMWAADVTGTCYLYSFKKSAELLKVRGNKARPTVVKGYADTLLLTAAKDCSTRLWNVERERPLRLFLEKTVVNTASLSRNGRLLLTGGQNEINLRDVREAAVVENFEFSNREVAFLDLVSEGQHLLFVTACGSVELRDLRNSGSVLRTVATADSWNFFSVTDPSLIGVAEQFYTGKVEKFAHKAWLALANKKGRFIVLDTTNLASEEDVFVSAGRTNEGVLGLSFGVEGILSIITK